MGTRADFYIGKNKDAQWIGSIAWDGYRSGIDEAILNAHTESEFTEALKVFFESRDDVTTPEMGWPWPWESSETSDCSYWFFEDRVWDARISNGNNVYVPCDEPEPDWENDDEDQDPSEKRKIWLQSREEVDFPTFNTDGFANAGNSRSGVILIRG